MADSDKTLVLPEVRLLLEAISKLAPVDAVVESSTAGGPPISVCFRDNERFRPFKIALREFRGNFRWAAIAHLPFVCVVPLMPKDISATPEQMRASAISDIASLAQVMENSLGPKDGLSQGVVIRPMAKRTGDEGPGGPALLVADPRRYLSNGFVPTSPRDRTVEYWISDAEGDLMYGELHPMRRSASGGSHTPLLGRVCESKYEDLIVLPSEVSALRDECERMQRDWPDLKPALDRIARICDMAVKDGLGIVVLGQ